MEINRDVQLLRRKIRQVPLFTSAVVLVLVLYFGLGLKNLVLFTSLPVVTTTSIMVSSNKIQNWNILLPAYVGCPGIWPLSESRLFVVVDGVLEDSSLTSTT